MSDKVNTILSPQSVESFPYENIEQGAIFTFASEIAKQVTDYNHGIHSYPAKFIPQIPRWAFDYSGLQRGDIVFDPFSGSGTTLLEANIQGYSCFGTEINPLGRLLAKVKTTPLPFLNETNLEIFLQLFRSKYERDKSQIIVDNSFDDINLHNNWNFWFEENTVMDLVKLKRNIRNLKSVGFMIDENELKDLKDFLLICYSTIIKKVSYFDEREIKVRKQADKFQDGVPDVLDVFLRTVKKHSFGMIEFSKHMGSNFGIFSEIIPEDATRANLNDNMIDLIVTSPPYLNAIDYPMAHKYNLFFLDLVKPDDYSEHCRAYTGVTERAVTKKFYSEKHTIGYKQIDNIINDLFSSNNVTDKIRAFIIWQYFDSMIKFLRESYRVLKPGKNLIIVIGDNNIRKRYIPTHEYIRDIAISNRVGFELDTYFYHQLRNIKLKVNRNKTGGKIKYEMVIVLKKPLVNI